MQCPFDPDQTHHFGSAAGHVTGRQCRLRRRLTIAWPAMHLVRQLHCLWSETGSIPVLAANKGEALGAAGSVKARQRSSILRSPTIPFPDRPTAGRPAVNRSIVVRIHVGEPNPNSVTSRHPFLLNVIADCVRALSRNWSVFVSRSGSPVGNASEGPRAQPSWSGSSSFLNPSNPPAVVTSL